MTTTKQTTISFIVTIAVGYYCLGGLIFPWWWYNFLFECGFLDFGKWVEDFLRVIEYFFYFLFSQSWAIALIVLLLIVPDLKSKIKIPPFNIFKTLPTVIFITTILAVTFFIHSKGKQHVADIRSRTYPSIEASSTPAKAPQAFSIETIIDPIYVNDNKINEIHHQISPSLTETKRTEETTTGQSKSAEAGVASVATLNGKFEATSEKKLTSEYNTTNETLSKKIVNIINSLSKSSHLSIYNYKELPNADTESLNSFKNIASKYKIPYSQRDYERAKEVATRNNFMKQKEELYLTQNLLLIEGEFRLTNSDNKVQITKEDVFSGGNSTIIFKFSAIPLSDFKTTFPTNENNAQAFQRRFKSLARITNIDDSTDNKLTIECDPYAIFY